MQKGKDDEVQWLFGELYSGPYVMSEKTTFPGRGFRRTKVTSLYIVPKVHSPILSIIECMIRQVQRHLKHIPFTKYKVVSEKSEEGLDILHL